MQKDLKQRKLVLRLVIPIVFFFIRCIGFYEIYTSVRSIVLASRKFLDSADDYTYILEFNLFQLYDTIKSIISENIYASYLSVAVMLHNTVFSMFVSAKTLVQTLESSRTTSYILSSTFLIEAIFTIYVIILQRTTNSYKLFKIIGASTKINNAFATRKYLEIFGTINVFMASLISGKLFLPISTLYVPFASIIFGFSLITYVQQIFISAKFNEEDMRQRKIAIFLTTIRIPLAVAILVWYNTANISDRGEMYSRSVITYLFVDIILLAIAMDYFLIQDTMQFGSGLKDMISFKTRQMNLE